MSERAQALAAIRRAIYLHDYAPDALMAQIEALPGEAPAVGGPQPGRASDVLGDMDSVGPLLHAPGKPLSPVEPTPPQPCIPDEKYPEACVLATSTHGTRDGVIRCDFCGCPVAPFDDDELSPVEPTPEPPQVDAWEAVRGAIRAYAKHDYGAAQAIAVLDSTLKSMLAALKRVEWCDTDGIRATCPLCMARWSDRAHKPDCLIGAALTGSVEPAPPTPAPCVWRPFGSGMKHQPSCQPTQVQIANPSWLGCPYCLKPLQITR